MNCGRRFWGRFWADLCIFADEECYGGESGLYCAAVSAVTTAVTASAAAGCGSCVRNLLKLRDNDENSGITVSIRISGWRLGKKDSCYEDDAEDAEDADCIVGIGK